VNVSICLGYIPNSVGGISFDVFPNPTQDNLNINIAVDKETDFVLEVKDVTGKLVMEQKAHFSKDNPQHQLNISSLSKGIYFLEIISDDGNSQPIKIIKE
jgi:hypothetical protein